MDQALMGGVVLAGGGSRLNGMCDVAEKVLNTQARNGIAIGIRDWPEEIDDSVWTTAAGFMMYSAKLKARDESQQRAAGFLGRMLR